MALGDLRKDAVPNSASLRPSPFKRLIRDGYLVQPALKKCA